METIEDIVREMRKRFEPYAKSNSNDAMYVAYIGYDEFADRIEAAVKALKADRDNWRRKALDEDARSNATSKDSLVVGNAQKMRDALKTISKCDISKEEDCYTIYRVCESALSAPPRNCDVYTEAELCEMVTEEIKSEFGTDISQGIIDIIEIVAKGMIKGLFAKAKGGE